MNKILIEELNRQFNNLNSSTGIGIVILLIIISILTWVCWVEVALWLWGIIAVKVFGLPTLSFWQFVGFNILISMLSGKISINLSSSKDK